MITYQELEKTASSIEEHGFTEDNTRVLEKTAQALFLLDKLKIEIDEPIDYSKIEKTAGIANRLFNGLGQTAIVGLGVAMAGGMAKDLEKSHDRRMFNKHRNGLVAFAKRENPALKDVSNGKLKMWLSSAYSVSPRVAKDPMLASTFLNTAHAVGGVDLNTAKTVSDIQHKGGGSYNTLYDAVTGQSSGLAGNISV